MIKKIIFGLTAIVSLASCNGDYTDWLNPQTNAAKDALEKADFIITPATTDIKLADVTSNEITLFTANMTETTVPYSISDLQLTLAGNDKEVTLDIQSDGKIATEELTSAVINLYGRAPQSRQITVSAAGIASATTEDGVVKVQKASNSYTMTVTPDAPHISQNYYIVGGTLEWAGSAASKAQKFTHSDKDVYDDPVFTIIIPASSGDTWFAIGDDEALDAITNNNDWSKLLGTTSGNGNSGASGMLAPRYNLNDDGSFKVDAGPSKIKVTINMLEGTYAIEAVPDVPEYYIVGRQNNWSLSNVSAMYPTSGSTVSYTSYFTGAWDCRISTPEQIAAGDWSNYGSEEENGQCTKLVAATGSCIMSPSAGYYTLNVNFETMTYSWTPVSSTPTSYERIGLVGAGDDWENDIFLTKVQGSGDLNGNDTHNWSATNVKLAASTWGVQFRADAGWAMQWGTTNVTDASGYIYGAATAKDNIPLHEAGTYDIYFNDITGQFLFIKK